MLAISRVTHSRQFLENIPIIFMEGNLGSSLPSEVSFSVIIAEPIALASS